jgi:hypothetical protein
VIGQESLVPGELSDAAVIGASLGDGAFEYLPATVANMSLLSLTARHPSARVVSGSTPAASASVK